MDHDKGVLKDAILKVDARGRVWTPRERRDAILDEFEKSGMPGTHFAARFGLKYPTLASWIHKRRRARSAVPSGAEAGSASSVSGNGHGARESAFRWIEAAPAAPGADTAGALSIHLPGGGRMQVHSASQAQLAATLLRALSAHSESVC